MLIPDPRGLWAQAFVGVLFFNDNYFYPWFIFCLIHYTIIWETSAANQFPPLMMWEFLVRMAYVFIWGSLAGLALTVALRTRPLIPTHTFRRGWPRLGIIFVTFGMINGIRGVMTLTGARRTHEDFGPDPSLPGTQALWIVMLIVYFAIFIGPLVLTYMDRKERDLWSWFAITYRDNLHNNLIIDYIVALTLVLGPQALWDFFVLPPILMPQLTAGIITLAAELVAWAAVYYWFTAFRNINATHFAREHSLVWFGEFVLIVGGLHIIVSGVVYVIAAEFLSTMIDAERVVGGSTAAVAIISIVLYFVLSNRRVAELRRQRKKERSDVDDERLLPQRERVTGRPLALSMSPM